MDQVGLELLRGLQRGAAVSDRTRVMAMRRQQVTEQLDVEGIVLDDQDLGQSELRNLCDPSLSHG